MICFQNFCSVINLILSSCKQLQSFAVRASLNAVFSHREKSLFVSKPNNDSLEESFVWAKKHPDHLWKQWIRDKSIWFRRTLSFNFSSFKGQGIMYSRFHNRAWSHLILTYLLNTLVSLSMITTYSWWQRSRVSNLGEWKSGIQLCELQTWLEGLVTIWVPDSSADRSFCVCHLSFSSPFSIHCHQFTVVIIALRNTFQMSL